MPRYRTCEAAYSIEARNPVPNFLRKMKMKKHTKLKPLALENK